jgi:hypothetical protein
MLIASVGQQEGHVALQPAGAEGVVQQELQQRGSSSGTARRGMAPAGDKVGRARQAGKQQQQCVGVVL